MTYGGINFKDFPDKQITNFHVVIGYAIVHIYWLLPLFFILPYISMKNRAYQQDGRPCIYSPHDSIQ